MKILSYEHIRVKGFEENPWLAAKRLIGYLGRIHHSHVLGFHFTSLKTQFC
jgi:hypothetical protein